MFRVLIVVSDRSRGAKCRTWVQVGNGEAEQSIAGDRPRLRSLPAVDRRLSSSPVGRFPVIVVVRRSLFLS